MEIYKFGKIIHVGKKNVILESRSTGYIYNVANVNKYNVGEVVKMYSYSIYSDYGNQKKSYGFSTFKEYIAFADLIGLNGIGPKISLSILEKDIDSVVKAIATKDVEWLQQINFVNEKAAKNIVFHLSNKYKNLLNLNNKKNNQQNENSHEILDIKSELKIEKELKNNLKMLGFKNHQIDFALNKLNDENHPFSDLEQLIQNAISLITSSESTRI